MSKPERLKIKRDQEAFLQPAGRLTLPLLSDRAAYGAVVAEQLFLWINGPAAGQTTLLCVQPDLTIETVASQPWTTAGLMAVADGFILTATAPTSRPIVATVSYDGELRWQHEFGGPRPTIWPRPFCPERPLLAWQTGPELLRFAAVDASGLSPANEYPVGGPPFSLSGGRDHLLAVWKAPAGIEGIRLTATGAAPFTLPRDDVSRVAGLAGSAADFLAWRAAGTVYVAPLDVLLGDPGAGKVVPGRGKGKLALIDTPKPIIWSQVSRYDDLDGLRLSHSFSRPDAVPLTATGFITTALPWGDGLALVGATDIHFLSFLEE